MTDEQKQLIENQLSLLANRINESPQHIDGEAVTIQVNVALRGREAVNYEIAKIFSPDSDHKQLVELLFRLGLKNAADIIKVIAYNTGIKL